MFKQPSPSFEQPTPQGGSQAAGVEAALPPIAAAEALPANPATPVAGEVALNAVAPESVPAGRFGRLRELWGKTVDTVGAVGDVVRDADVQQGARALGETVVAGLILAGRVAEARNASKSGSRIKPERAAENRALLAHAGRRAPGNMRSGVTGARAAKQVFGKSFADRRAARAERQRA